MTIRTRIQPIADWVSVVVRDDLSPAAQSAAVAQFARDRLGEAREKNRTILGRVSTHRTFVDGRENVPLESVRPKGGRIVFEFDLVEDALQWIWATLRERSPVVKGDYLRGHRVFADGIEVLATDAVPAAAEYAFLNIVPYARRIEVGKRADGTPFLLQVPNRIYERTAEDARRRFGNIASIKFGYRSPVMAYQAAGTAGAAASRRGGIERETRTPAIIVTMR
ncbi:MAG: hypothetical protein AB7F22_10640 [Reyranella sp.]|uniref:hypothetical protein n=1 Tax=Reyranella sp. TaxID=1929291 RepID=UPI003D1021C6